MPAELRAFLHDFIDAVAGAGHSDRLHAQLDAIGKPADPAPAAVEGDNADAAPVVADAPAATEPGIEVPADELASFRAWQAAQAAPADPVAE